MPADRVAHVAQRACAPADHENSGVSAAKFIGSHFDMPSPDQSRDRYGRRSRADSSSAYLPAQALESNPRPIRARATRALDEASQPSTEHVRSLIARLRRRLLGVG